MVSLKFKCSIEKKDFIELEVINNRLEIIIVNKDEEFEDNFCGVILDKSTAIKLSKELRKQIALIQDEEGI
jgi:hypothetical protein